MFSRQFTWSWAAEHGYWGWRKFIWMQKTVWRNPQKQNHPRAFKYRGAALGSEAPWTTNNVVQCLKECCSVSSILFPWHQHQSWDDGLTWSFLASARPGSLEGRGVFGGPECTMFCTTPEWLGALVSGHTIWLEKFCMQGKIYLWQAGPCVVAPWLFHG